MVLLQVPDLSSEVSTFMVGSFSTQPITHEIMRIPIIEHVFIMPESFRGRLSSVNRSALASTLSLRSMETIGLLATHCGGLIAPMPARCVKVVIAERQVFKRQGTYRRSLLCGAGPGVRG